MDSASAGSMAEEVFREGLEKLEQVQSAAVGEVMFPRPVINEGRLDELSLLLPEKSSGTGPGCSLKGCINAMGAGLSSLASAERIQMSGL